MQGDMYGYWTILSPGHWGCNYCGAEIFAVAEPRWCVVYQGDIWDDCMREYRAACKEVHDNNVQ